MADFLQFAIGFSSTVTFIYCRFDCKSENQRKVWDNTKGALICPFCFLMSALLYNKFALFNRIYKVLVKSS